MHLLRRLLQGESDAGPGARGGVASGTAPQ
jgi:hypothetical protein